MNTQNPKTLQEAIIAFSNPETAFNTMKEIRWAGGEVACPHCGGKALYFINTRKLWKCKDKACNKQFTIKVGTIMEDSALGIDKWLCAIWMIANAKNGVSSYEIHRSLGITQKSAWHVLHRIRTAMQNGTFTKLSGEIEADETAIGGLEKNKHFNKRANAGRGSVGKTIAMVVMERDGEARASVIQDTTKETLHSTIKAHVEKGSNVFTDAFPSYKGLNKEYVHQVIDHSIEYVNGNITTNHAENFFSLLKRTIKGTYIHIHPSHLQHYLDEQIMRFNMRKGNDRDRFLHVASRAIGKKLTYETLINEMMP